MDWIEDVFDKTYKERLDLDPYHMRATSFRKIFHYLIDLGKTSYTIVETNSIRTLGEWGRAKAPFVSDTKIGFWLKCADMIR